MCIFTIFFMITVFEVSKKLCHTMMYKEFICSVQYILCSAARNGNNKCHFRQLCIPLHICKVGLFLFVYLFIYFTIGDTSLHNSEFHLLFLTPFRDLPFTPSAHSCSKAFLSFCCLLCFRTDLMFAYGNLRTFCIGSLG